MWTVSSNTYTYTYTLTPPQTLGRKSSYAYAVDILVLLFVAMFFLYTTKKWVSNILSTLTAKYTYIHIPTNTNAHTHTNAIYIDIIIGVATQGNALSLIAFDYLRFAFEFVIGNYMCVCAFVSFILFIVYL